MSRIALSFSTICRRSLFCVNPAIFHANRASFNLTAVTIEQRSLNSLSHSYGSVLVHRVPLRLVDSRFTSTSSPSNDDKKDAEMNAKKSSLVQRFKESYAIYGKMVIVIHGITSCFWFGGAYLFASTGLNLLDLFEAAHFPEWACRPLRFGGGSVNTWATALILYKLIAPFRYGATLLLTRFAVRYLRSKGKVPQLAERDRLRNLARESAKLSRERLKARVVRGRRKATTEAKKQES